MMIQHVLIKSKKNILKSDNNFPKTSKLNIYLVKDETKNALCLPNGDIYITSSLYEKLTDDEMLTFVIAHEMAHYKNKDHLKNIRHKIAKSTITIFLSLAIPNDSTISNISDDGLEINELGFSRGCEKQADIYAGKILLVLYNNTIGGQKVLNTLREKTYPGILRLYATHPDIDSRIKVLRQLKQHHLKSGF